MFSASLIRSFSSYGSALNSQLIFKSSSRYRYFNYFISIRNKANVSRKREPIKRFIKSDRPFVKVWTDMSIRELARTLYVEPNYILHLLSKTEYAHIFEKFEDRIHQRDLIAQLVKTAGYKSEFIQLNNDANIEEDKDAYRRPPADPSQCLPRSPVVTIMGHVDHGKTTLLDYLRHSQIAAQEFGGITQHIGAFVVKLPHTGAKITFLDTPGHAAFKSMRARGARVTDIVVLVVAADDGVMEQTLESIRFAREAGVAMVVAINKCDKPNADIKKAKADLLAQNIAIEEYGGDVQTICISALQGTNLVALQEAIVAQADLMNLKADYKGLVEGAVIEAKTVHGKGGVCTVLIQRGTLKKGCVLVAGEAWCKVRALYDEFGKPVSEATPSMPVEITGWKDELPSAGDEILELETEKRVKEVVAWRKKKAMEAKAEADRPVIDRQRSEAREKYERERKERLAIGFIKWNPTLVPDTSKPNESVEQIPEFNVIIKGDVDGSVEAILEVYETYASQKCKFDVVSFGIGPVTDGDLEMAEVCKAKIYCFNVKNSPAIEKQAAAKNLHIKHFNVIYKLVDDWKNELSSKLPLMDKDEIHGEGIVLQEFLVTEKGRKGKTPVAGCRVTKGVISKKYRVRFLRDDEIIYDGQISSMKKEKITTGTANVNEEVGILIEEANVNFRPQDIVRCYETIKVPQRTDWTPPGF